MKLEALLSFWKMKELIVHRSCITRDRIYDTDEYHVTYMITVSNCSMHANVLYRYTEEKGIKSKFALIYADILFSGFPDLSGATASVCQRNVKICDLAREFASRLK